MTSLPSLVKGSAKQSRFFNQWRVRPRYGEYRRKEWSVSNENFKFKVRKHPFVNCTERTGLVPATRFIPSLKLEGQAGESAAMRVIFSTYRSNYQVSMWRRIIVLRPSLARFGKVAATHAYELTFLQLMMLEQKMLYMRIYVYVKFSKRECQQWRMVLWEWCKLWDHNAFVLKHVLEHVSRRRGRGTPLFGLYTSGICCWTQGLEY